VVSPCDGESNSRIQPRLIKVAASEVSGHLIRISGHADAIDQLRDQVEIVFFRSLNFRQPKKDRPGMFFMKKELRAVPARSPLRRAGPCPPSRLDLKYIVVIHASTGNRVVDRIKAY